MLVSSILEFILGNTFPAVVFASFSAFWLTFGGTLLPQFYAYASYAPVGAASPAEGLEVPSFSSGFGTLSLLKSVLPEPTREWTTDIT